MPTIDWDQMLTFTVSPLELFLHGTLTVVRRDTGTLGPSDLLVLVIIADASQNAMAGDYQSVPDGFVLIATLIGWSYMLNWLSFRYEPFRRLALPQPLCIVKDGIKQDAALRRELIADEELAEMLREHEIDDIALVHRAYLEPDGQVTVIRRRGTPGERGGTRHRVP